MSRSRVSRSNKDELAVLYAKAATHLTLLVQPSFQHSPQNACIQSCAHDSLADKQAWREANTHFTSSSTLS
jgi:hypothetical protein